MSEQSQKPREPKARVDWNGEECAAAFANASVSKPWTIGYASLNEDLSTHNLDVVGNLPPGVRGTLFRNGPARHELGGQRYGHRWDGDGMVQAFRFGSAVSHEGRFTRTAKFIAETAANKFMFSAFGTCIPGCPPIADDMDEMNSANISVCMAGGELLALWEPGSAYRIDPSTLETIGIKTWHSDLLGQAFSAHPKREPTGETWNFGANPLTGALTLYCSGEDGNLIRSHTLQIENLPPIHDFAVTDRHLVFVLPPTPVNKDRLASGMSFAHSCEWSPGLGSRVLVVAKSDWSQRWYDLPPSALFHVSNAWEDRSGTIRLQFMGAENPMSLFAGWTIMRGDYRHRPGAFMTLVELGPGTTATHHIVKDLEGEFPVVDPSLIGRQHRTVLCLGRSTKRDPEVPGYDDLVSFDVESGQQQRYSYGEDWLVEEHLLVPDATDPNGPAAWIVGTALNLQEKRTSVSVFSAHSIQDGPVARVHLPYALPLGLHGVYQPKL